MCFLLFIISVRFDILTFTVPLHASYNGVLGLHFSLSGFLFPGNLF